jgi:N-acetylmuramoyl-L-alanine amidase
MKGGFGLISNKWILISNLVVLFCIALFVVAQPCLADEAKFSNICLESRQLSPDFRFIEQDGQKYINLPFLRVFFHIATSWNPADTELYFRFGTYNFKMYAAKTTYYVNGTSRTLPVAPFEKNGDFWIPLNFFVRLGLQVTEQTTRRMLFLKWQANYILGIENITYQDRPAFLIVGAKELNLKQYPLQKPERTVCDLAGTKPHFTMQTTLKSSNPLVKQVRIKTNQAISSSLVFDLTQPASCKIIREPQKPNQAILVFNYFINDVRLVTQENEATIRIKSSFPADYKVKTLPESNQLLVKLNGATFPEITKTIDGNHQKLRSIRINQDDSNTVSVLLELNNNATFFVTRSRLDPTQLEIKTPSIIREVSFSKTKTGSILTINSNSELNENIRLLAPFKQLQIDLENAQFDANLCQNLPVADQTNSVRLLPVTANIARIEVNLANLVAYNVKVSANRHKISVFIKNSTLPGKFIVLDPGHGGIDTGACGKQNTREKDINLEVALKLKTMLELAGAKVMLTRNTDHFISLYERCYFANYHHADLFISIHANSHPDSSIRGIEVFHYNGQKVSQKLAQKVLNQVTKSTGFKALGVKSNRFVVIRETQMPSVLIELGFLSNYQEETILKTSEFKEKAALGIMQGLIDFY